MITIDLQTKPSMPGQVRFFLAVVFQFLALTGIWTIHQLLTRTSWVLHQCRVEGLTRRAVILKESRGEHPQTFTPQNHDYFSTSPRSLPFGPQNVDEVKAVNPCLSGNYHHVFWFSSLFKPRSIWTNNRVCKRTTFDWISISWTLQWLEKTCCMPLDHEVRDLFEG